MSKFNCGVCKYYVGLNDTYGKGMCVRFPPMPTFEHGYEDKHSSMRYINSFYKPAYEYPKIEKSNYSCGKFKDKRSWWKIIMGIHY